MCVCAFQKHENKWTPLVGDCPKFLNQLLPAPNLVLTRMYYSPAWHDSHPIPAIYRPVSSVGLPPILTFTYASWCGSLQIQLTCWPTGATALPGVVLSDPKILHYPGKAAAWIRSPWSSTRPTPSSWSCTCQQVLQPTPALFTPSLSMKKTDTL